MLKFKRKFSFILIMLLTVSMLLMGCSNHNTPEAKVDKLFKSAKKLDIKGMEEVLETDPEKALEDELDENIEDFDEEAEFKKYTQIALDAFNESANTYETQMTSNVFEIKLNQDESGEWLISAEESDMVLFSALFFNFINLELIDQYIENFS